jgi:hypothetical protein
MPLWREEKNYAIEYAKTIEGSRSFFFRAKLSGSIKKLSEF